MNIFPTKEEIKKIEEQLKVMAEDKKRLADYYQKQYEKALLELEITVEKLERFIKGIA